MRKLISALLLIMSIYAQSVVAQLPESLPTVPALPLAVPDVPMSQPQASTAVRALPKLPIPLEPVIIPTTTADINVPPIKLPEPAAILLPDPVLNALPETSVPVTTLPPLVPEKLSSIPSDSSVRPRTANRVFPREAPGSLMGTPTADPFTSNFFRAPGGETPSPTVGTGPRPDPLGLANTRLKNERVFTYGEFFFGGGQGTLVPPLVIVAPPGATAGAATGFGAPGTSVLFGNRRLMKNLRPGFRAGAGFWFDRESKYGIEFNAVALQDLSERFLTSAATGGVVVARPIVNGLTNTNAGFSFGTILPATIAAQVDTAYWGADANLRYNVWRSDLAKFDLLVGYRYAQLGDQVFVDGTQIDPASIAATIASGLTFFGGTPQVDFFRTRNQFHGGQVGLAGTIRMADRVTLSGRGTVALGATVSEVNLGGTVTQPGGTGLLVQSTNAGTYRNSEFAVMPELAGNIGIDATERLRFNLGYSWTYWSKVYRAADQIDLTVLAPNRPAFLGNSTDYWIQGWTLGFNWHW